MSARSVTRIHPRTGTPVKPVGGFGRWLSGHQLTEQPAVWWAAALMWSMFVIRRCFGLDLGFIARFTLLLTGVFLGAAMVVVVLLSTGLVRGIGAA